MDTEVYVLLAYDDFFIAKLLSEEHINALSIGKSVHYHLD